MNEPSNIGQVSVEFEVRELGVPAWDRLGHWRATSWRNQVCRVECDFNSSLRLSQQNVFTLEQRLDSLSSEPEARDELVLEQRVVNVFL